MATTVMIDSTRPAKIRHPVAVPVLMICTLGIYAFYWWYQVNREMVDLGRVRNVEGLGDSAGTSLAAWFPGALIIFPPIFSLYNGNGRLQRAQEVVLGERTESGWVVLGLILGGFLIPFLGIVAYGYMQSELNKVWEGLQSDAPPPAIEGSQPQAQFGQSEAETVAAPPPPATPAS
jgi:hypothetical protein